VVLSPTHGRFMPTHLELEIILLRSGDGLSREKKIKILQTNNFSLLSNLSTIK